MGLSKLATPDEIKPPNGAQKLDIKSQIMHMFVHHNQVLLSSSLIIVIVVGLSVYLGSELPLLSSDLSNPLVQLPSPFL